MDAKRANHLSGQRVQAEQIGRDLSAPVAVTHFFSSPGRHPAAIVRALRELAITDVVVDEELSGDGYWHVAAFGALRLVAPEVDRDEGQMERIAQSAGARYDGWKLTLTAGEERRFRR